MKLKRTWMTATVLVALVLAYNPVLARPWHSSEEYGSWGSYAGIGNSFGGSLSASLGGHLGLGLFHDQQNGGGSKGSGINLFGTGTPSLAGSGHGNFGIFSGGHRYPKGYRFLLFGRPVIGGNQPFGNDGQNQPDQQAGVAPDPEPEPSSVSPAAKPSIEVPYEVDTTGIANNAAQPDMDELPGTSQTELQPDFQPAPPERVPLTPIFPRDSLSVESIEYPQSEENSIEFFSAEADDIGGEVTSDEVVLGGAGILSPRIGLNFSSEEKPSFFDQLKRMFG